MPGHFSLLTHSVFSDKSCHHTEPWVPPLEHKLVGLDMSLCKYKAWALEDSAHLAVKPHASAKLQETSKTPPG